MKWALLFGAVPVGSNHVPPRLSTQPDRATFRYPFRVHRVWDLERGSCVSSHGESCQVLNVEPSHSCRIWGRSFIPIYNQRWTLATHFYQTLHIDYKLSIVMVDRCLSDHCLFWVIIRKQEIRSRVSNSRNDCDAKLFWFTRRYSAHIFNIDLTNTVTAFLQQEFFLPGVCFDEKWYSKETVQSHLLGAPNENIVQNHLNIALLNVV